MTTTGLKDGEKIPKEQKNPETYIIKLSRGEICGKFQSPPANGASLDRFLKLYTNWSCIENCTVLNDYKGHLFKKKLGIILDHKVTQIQNYK